MSSLIRPKVGVVFALFSLFVIGTGLQVERVCAAEKLDVVFGIDLTGSMGDEIDSVKTNANYIMNQVASLVPDCAFGVITIVDYPHEYSSYGYSGRYGSAADGDYAYRKDLDITTNRNAVANILNGLYLRWGADNPQDYVRMLYESQFLNWRAGATRILVVFGDAPAHDNDLFSQSYGGDPGRDEIMFTADDLDYQNVIQQVKAAKIIVVSVDSGGAPSGSGYDADVYRNFEYMASETDGRHFMLANASQIPEAILELIRGSIIEEFVWQQIVMDGKTYTVKVKATKKPNDPSTFVYPVYCGDCEVDYEPRSMTVVDPIDTVVTDESTLRKVLAYARNAALYRSLASSGEDPIAVLDKLGGFEDVPRTPPPQTHCWLGIWPCVTTKGDTDTSFGYEYPGYLIFPDEYIGANGVHRLVDWEWSSDVGVKIVQGDILIWDYIHPAGMSDYEQRKKVYTEMLHHFVLQDGIEMMERESAANMLSLLEQTEQALDLLGYIEDAQLVHDIVYTVKQAPGVGQNAFREAMRQLSARGLHFSKTSMSNISKGFKVQNHYTGWATKAAPVIGFFLEVGLTKWKDGLELAQDQFIAIIQSMAMYDHGLAILNALKTQLFDTGHGGIDKALSDAFAKIGSEFSLSAGETFYIKFFEELSTARQLGKDIDSAQLMLSAAAAIAAVVPGGQPVAVALTCVNLGISLIRAGWDIIVWKLEHEERQQETVLCATMEYAWWERPLKNYSLGPLFISGATSNEDIDHINWLISTKLFQGTFVTDEVLQDTSGFINDIIAWFDATFGKGKFDLRRKELNKYRDRLIDIFFGRGDTDEALCRLAGRPTAEGTHIGFVPKKELDYLVDLTKPGAALAGHKMRCLLHSPGEIGIIDPAGRHLGTFGYDAGGGKFVTTYLNQIPRGSYSGGGSEPREVVIQEPIAGDYQISLFGTETGAYTMQVQALSGDVIISESETHGTFEPNRLEDGVVAVEASPTGFAVEIASEPIPLSCISGTVTDGNSGFPIEGARITAGGMSDITGTDGTFIIANVTPSTLIILTTVRGYVPYASAEIELLPGQNLVHNIKLVQPYSVDNLVNVSVEQAGYDHRSAQFGMNITVPSTSNTLIGNPLWLVIESISNTSVKVVGASGVTINDKPYIDLSDLLEDGQLDPDESVSKRIYFYNPNGVRFTFEPSVRGIIVETGEGAGLGDLARLSGHWLGNEPSLDVAPLGGDGIVNLRDFAVLAEHWLEGK